MGNEKKRLRWNAVADRFKNHEGPIIGAELGVWRGNMSQNLLSLLPDLQLTMVDRWAPPVPGDSYHTSGSEMALCDEQKFNKVFAEAMERTFLFSDRIKIIESTTTEAAQFVIDKTLDFCFIDADHSYEGVKNDIIHWRDKVKSGGLLCGHDWGNIKKGNVQKAVEEFFPRERIELDCNSTWFVRM